MLNYYRSKKQQKKKPLWLLNETDNTAAIYNNDKQVAPQLFKQGTHLIYRYRKSQRRK